MAASKQKYVLWLSLALAATLCGCNLTRHLKKGQVLLRNDPTYVGAQSLTADVLSSGVKTKANTRLIQPKAYLGLYNLGVSIREDNSPLKKFYYRLDHHHRYENAVVHWLTQTIGEPPALINRDQLKEDAENLKSIYFGEGFLEATVKPRITLAKLDPKLGDVTFVINEGHPYVLQNIAFLSSDAQLVSLVEKARSSSLLQLGERYNETKLTDERVRISNLAKDGGYFRFSPDAVNYSIDTSRGATADTVAYKPKRKKKGPLSVFEGAEALSPHPVCVEVLMPDTLKRYTISKVSITLRRTGELNDSNAITIVNKTLTPLLRSAYHLPARWLDTTYDVEVKTRQSVAPQLNMNVVARRLTFKVGDLYTLTGAQHTQFLLQGLGIFRNSIVTFTPNDSLSTLTANIDLVLQRRYSINYGVEAFISENRQLSSNLPGIGLRLGTQVANIFGRAERLEVQGSSSVSIYSPGSNLGTELFTQLTGRVNFTIPRFFLLEGLSKNSLVRFRPTTTFSLSVNAENRREYQRTYITGAWLYRWYPKPFSQNSQIQFSPLTVTWVSTTRFPAFDSLLKSISNSSLRQFVIRDFQPRYSTKSTFYYAYSADYAQSRTHTTWFIKPGIEAGGNIPYLLDVLDHSGNKTHATAGDSSTADGLLYNKYVYGQFIKLAFEGKVFKPLGKNAELIGRIFLGFAHGVNHTTIVPYENRFFTGGTSSLRGWQSNTLGPGTFRDSIQINNLIAPGGEYALESNLELRSKIAGNVHGALFVDAGNVWFSSNGGFNDPRGKLSAKTFKLGVDAGIGLRFDLQFFILRVDIGQQIYAPDVQEFIVKRFPHDIGGNRIQYNLGIGYPF